MLDIHSLLKNLVRPRLLVKAARFALDGYRRESDLKRLLQIESAPRPSRAILMLLDLESELNNQRTNAVRHYSAGRHIEVLSAIMAEQRLIARAPT